MMSETGYIIIYAFLVSGELQNVLGESMQQAALAYRFRYIPLGDVLSIYVQHMYIYAYIQIAICIHLRIIIYNIIIVKHRYLFEMHAITNKDQKQI